MVETLPTPLQRGPPGDAPVTSGHDEHALRPRAHARRQGDDMSEVQHGLEGVVAFETEIAEPDKEGSSLRYRGVDIEEIVGKVPFETSGACSSTAIGTRACRRPRPTTSRSTPATSASTSRPRSPCWPRVRLPAGLRHHRRPGPRGPARVAVMVLSYAAQAARGLHQLRRTPRARSTTAARSQSGS